MPTKKKSSATKPRKLAAPMAMSTENAEKVLRSAKPATVKLARRAGKPSKIKLLKAPKRFNKPKRVHPRRFPHRIVEGEESAAFSTTPVLALAAPLEEAAPAPMATTDTIALARNTELTQA